MEDYGYSNYKLFLSGDLQGFENIVKYYRNNLILFKFHIFSFLIIDPSRRTPDIRCRRYSK